MSRWVRCGVLAIALATLAACGGGGGGNATPKPSPERLAGQLKEFSVAFAKTSLPAGRVRFVVQNAGTVKHMFVVLRTDLAPDKLPVEGNVVDVKGAGVTLVGQIDPFDPGKVERKVVTVSAGAHVLICNVPTHYQQGMRAALTIT